MDPTHLLLVVDMVGSFVVDDRCVGSDGAHVDERGDLYVRAHAPWGAYAAYGDDAPSVRTCLLFDQGKRICVRMSWTWYGVYSDKR